MVMISSLWMEPQSKSRPMNREGCGLSVPSPAQAWYLGKGKDEGLLSKNCPWCSAKGQTHILHSYAINFEESITLCTNPQCLYPLVSKPLDYSRDTISSSQDSKKLKRNFSSDPNQSPKRQKKESDDLSEDIVDLDDINESAISFVDGQTEIVKPIENTCTTDSTGTNGTEGPSYNAKISNPVSITRDETPQTNDTDLELIEMVPTQPHLFWRNTNNLCWLNSLLVALMHFRSFKESPDDDVGLADPLSSVMRNFCVKFNKSCAYLRTKEQMYKENIVRVPSGVLQKTEEEIEALRYSVLQFLQPKLKYKLGQEETPVFALPLLLKSDNWASSLFQHTGQWEFKCTSCGYNLNSSVEKTVTTFTEIVADWHPLRAIQRVQCNNCFSKKQKRKLVLQRLSSVLALHFVGGLPRKDVSRYSFNFEGTPYNIKTIIQYNNQLKHFTTWIHQPNGSWLEFDDLKYPHCITHKRFTLPASQFHIVFWEAETDHLPADYHPVVNSTLQSTNKGTKSKDTVNSPVDDVGIVEALTLNDAKNDVANTLDSSIGSTTLLDTFEGLSHSDIVTLTLVEVVEPDSKEKPPPTSQESVVGPAESSVAEKPSYSQTLNSNNISCDQNISPIPDIASPVATRAASQVSPCQPPLNSLNRNSSSLSFLYKQHPSNQSTPLYSAQLQRDVRSESNQALPFKPAELFCGFRPKNAPNSGLPEGHLKKQQVKQQAPFIHPSGASVQKSADKDNLNLSHLSTTEVLRLKLMKKLKTKKKKLAKLNQLLCKEDSESTPKPDSTYVCSSYSVTSSTSVYSSPSYDSFFSELLSPPSSVSNLSPDSTGFQEKPANNQAVAPSECISQDDPTTVKSDFSSSIIPEDSLNNLTSSNDFFEEFMSGSELHQSGNVNTDLNALDLFF